MLRFPHCLRPCLAALAFAATPAATSAQRKIETPEGSAEVIGLKRWTADMLADSLGLHAPGVSLFQTTECTKALTGRLHFSSVYIEKTIVAPFGTPAQSVVIRLVEPEDSARIRWAQPPRDSEPTPVRWANLRRVFFDDARGVFIEDLNGLGLYGIYLKQGESNAVRLAVRMGVDTVRAIGLWTTLRRHARAEDRRLALRALRHDGSRQNRMLAAAILANFPESDEAWRALVAALRDPYPGVNIAALHSVTLLGNSFARPIDWRPAAPSLRALLDGTNLAAFMPLVRVLTQTRIAPELARPLLGAGGGELLVAHDEALDRPSHEAAEALLRQLHGAGPPPTGWREWVASL